MSIIVTDTGFAKNDSDIVFVALDAATPSSSALDLSSDTDPDDLTGQLDGITHIRVDFPSFADGRGFSIARALRRVGYRGRLRARGHVLADQYAMARRSGFDEVEIDDALAARQPVAQWLFRADWQNHDHRAHLAGPALTGRLRATG